jgi:uncharacterized protein YdiU (UPF0061 family)
MTVAASLFRFEDSYARAVPGLSVPWTAASAPAPELRVLNEELAVELGVDPAALREPSGVALLVGQVPPGVTTVAQAYAGQVVQDHVYGGAVRAGRPDRFQRGQRVVTALAGAGDAPRLIIAEAVAAVEVADPVSAPVGGAQPPRPGARRPDPAVGGPDR